jgi:outer membrane receptor protein involved in Fe transport
MKNLFVLLLVIICWAGSFAQTTHPGTVAGSLTDSLTSGPIPYANVVLLLADKLFTGTTTDATGAFVLANLPYGRYTMVFSYVGYTSKKLHIIISQDKPVQQLGAVVLSAESKTLTEVTVTSRKALVEDKGDRLVYNAEKDISNAAGMAADVLRKVPMLSVDLHGNLQMRGSGNIKVLINGKPSAMMARNLTEALRQMPAHIIKSVEVITSPGARYDAEGSAGVINIITKKPLKGFSGGANGNAGNLGQGVGMNLMVKTKKIGLSTSASAYQYRSISENEFTRTTLSGGEPLHTL